MNKWKSAWRYGSTPLITDLIGRIFHVRLRGLGRFFLRHNIKVVAKDPAVPVGVNYSGGFCRYKQCPNLEKRRKKGKWGSFRLLQGEKEVLLNYNVVANNRLLQRISDGIRWITDHELAKQYQFIGEFRYKIIVNIPVVKFTLREISFRKQENDHK